VLAEIFPFVDMTEVDFNRRDIAGGKSVANSDAGVGVCRRVDQDSVKDAAGIPDRVDDRSFMVALENLEFSAKLCRKR